MQSEFSDKRCLVTGGTGFIGGRLVETLASEGADVRVLARNLSKASRVGRFPVTLVRGDLANRAEVTAATEGCDYVFHCAVGTSPDEAESRAATVDGTRHIIDGAAKAKARLVHVSTVSVYGPPSDGDLDETTPRRPDGDFYGETKLEAENAALDAARAGTVRASVIQPTVVYGPFGPAWTVRTFSELSTGRVMLIDGGDGLCNVVYVDDIVQGLRLAALRDEAIGEAFLISGPEPVTWREFYAAHERILGFESHVDRTAAEAHALFQKLYGKKAFLPESLSLVRESADLRGRLKGTKEVQALLRAVKLVVPPRARKSIQNKLRGVRPRATSPAPTTDAAANGTATIEKPVHPMGPAGIEMCRAKSTVRVDKARRLLGYEPAFDFEAGMERVGAWARWANLLESADATR